MIQAALNQEPNAQLHIVPTQQNPLKESPGASMELIQAWLEDLSTELAPQDFARCLLETYELNSRSEKSYTVDTLKAIHSEKDWVLLLGSDSAESFLKWKNPTELLSLIKEVWIVPRGQNFSEETLLNLKKIFAQTQSIFMPPVINISSSQIRNGATSQQGVEFLSPRVLSVWNKLQS